ncbi:DUF2238 domain-containing protein [Candidatus Woesearchaeota archaeon]|nr:DUF2238 domain-containing protein [Candidatus Woesearchaeota archaeon]
MLIKKGQWPAIIVHSLALLIFSFIFIFRQNYEFLWYIVVIILVMLLVLFTNDKVDYPTPLIWGLTIWSIMHMAGGGLYFGGTRLYEIIVIPLIGEPYLIFKYDQLAHLVGFAVATMLMYYLIRPLIPDPGRKIALFIVVVMAGIGAGALNEIIEFFVTIVVPNTGVGGYVNTALDLVFNLLGSLVALVFLLIKEKT